MLTQKLLLKEIQENETVTLILSMLCMIDNCPDYLQLYDNTDNKLIWEWKPTKSPVPVMLSIEELNLNHTYYFCSSKGIGSASYFEGLLVFYGDDETVTIGIQSIFSLRGLVSNSSVSASMNIEGYYQDNMNPA